MGWSETVARRRWAVAAVVVALAVAACSGRPPATSPARSAAPQNGSQSAAAATDTATPTPALSPSAASTASTVSWSGSLPSACEGGVATPTASAGSSPILAAQTNQGFELVDDSGNVLNTFDSSGWEALGTTPGGVYLYDGATGMIAELGLTGPPDDLGDATSAQAGGFPPAVSPNGKCWIATTDTFAGGGLLDTQDMVATTTVYGGEIGGPQIQLVTLTRGNDDGGGFPVIVWTTTGVLLGTDSQGTGGGGPGFELNVNYREMRTNLLDPFADQISSDLCPDHFQDLLTALGMVACRSSGGTSDTEFEIGPLGSAPQATIDAGAVVAGDAGFAANGALLHFCTFTMGSGENYSETLWSIPIAGSAGGPRSIMTGDQWAGCGEAHFDLPSASDVGEDSIAVFSPTSSALDIVDLATGGVTPIPIQGLSAFIGEV